MRAETPDPRSELSTRSFDAVIFDFDETIIDLEPQHTAAHAALCRDLGKDYFSMPVALRTASGNRIIDDIRAMREQFGWTQPEEELYALRQQHFDRLCASAPLALMPGVRETVEALRDRGFVLAITSSAAGASIEAILIRLELRDAFSLIVDGGDVVNGKPDPEPYLVTAEKLGMSPDRCLVIEDSRVGVIAARRAGMACVAVPNPHAQTAQDLSAADAIVTRIDEILVILQRSR